MKPKQAKPTFPVPFARLRKRIAPRWAKTHAAPLAEKSENPAPLTKKASTYIGVAIVVLLVIYIVFKRV